MESRPLSRDKRWVVEKIIKAEVRTADKGVAEIVAEPAEAVVTAGEAPAEAQS